MKKTLIAFLALSCAAVAGQAIAGGNAEHGKAKAAAVCAACHGADGNSTSPDFPRLAGQHADYIEHALLAYQSGDRKNPIMAGMAATLSKQDIADVAAWFSSQQGLYVKK